MRPTVAMAADAATLNDLAALFLSVPDVTPVRTERTIPTVLAPNDALAPVAATVTPLSGFLTNVALAAVAVLVSDCELVKPVT